ncbi:AAA family ATPase [Isoptericola sp. NPDC056605]|uniref:AAA family ATPase n=1 Tax=Isoptericola sp. NPDC056605 TaxID=3345876 RepID=UPI0036BF47BC
MSAVVEVQTAEQSVVGACLLEPATAVRQCAEEVTGDDFRDPVLGALYELVVRRYLSREPVDLTLLLPAIREAGIKVDASYLHDLVSGVPTASNAGFYARRVAEYALRRRLAATGIRFQQLAEVDEDEGSMMAHAREEWQSVSGKAVGRLRTKTLGEVLEGSDEYDWLIPNLLERMDRLILTGGEGAGKSTFVRQLAVLAAAGVHPMLFSHIDPVRVLVIDAENTERQWRRAVRVMATKARQAGAVDPRETLHMACVDEMPSGRLNLTDERDLSLVHRKVDEHQPDLLVIGPLYKLVPKAINNDDDAAPLINALDGLRARGMALVMEAHAGKGLGAAGERDLAPRGSAALMGWPEFGLGLRADREALAQLAEGEKPTVFQFVRWRGDRDERAWPDRIVRGGEWPWTDERRATNRTWAPSGAAWSPSDAGRTA